MHWLRRPPIPTSDLLRGRGVALIIVLMIVALVSVLATEMGSRLQLQIQRTVNIKDNNQAYWYAMGAEQYAIKAIRTLLKENKGVISISQPWSQPLSYPVEGGSIEAQLSDAQACFNLNALQSQDANEPEHQARLLAFHALLGADEFALDSYSRDIVTGALADWLDTDSNLRNYGAEDPDYQSLVPPYLAANAKMSNKTELRLIKGVKPSWLLKLMPYVCALPDSDKLQININTLREENSMLLAALTGLSNAEAQRRLGARPPDGYKDVSNFLSEPEIANANLTDEQKGWFTVTTEYFTLHTKSSYNDASFFMSSLLKVENDQVQVVRREFGGIR